MAQAAPKLKRILDSHSTTSSSTSSLPVAAAAYMDILPPEIRQRIPTKLSSSPSLSQEHKPRRRASVLVPIIHITDQSTNSNSSSSSRSTSNNKYTTIPSILFTKRSSRMKDHANQVSFPGGHLDEIDDGCPIRAALRETKEELTRQPIESFNNGELQPQQHDNVSGSTTSGSNSSIDAYSYNFQEGITILGRTGDIPSTRNIPVTPIIGMFQEEFTSNQLERFFPGNQEEVSSVFAVRVDELASVEDREYLSRLGMEAPVYHVKGGHGKIWGLTALILQPILHNVFKPVFLDKEGIV